MPWGVEAIKRKRKNIIGHIYQEIVPQNAKDGRGKNNKHVGKSQYMSSTPIHGHHPGSIGPRWASFIIQEPMIVPTPGGQWTAYLKEGNHYYILHIMLLPLSPKQLIKENS